MVFSRNDCEHLVFTSLAITVLALFVSPVVATSGSSWKQEIGVRPSATHDNDVAWDSVCHDSRHSYYRNPGWATQKTGAVPLGTDVTLRIRTAKDDLTSVTVKLWDNPRRTDVLLTMTVASSDELYDYWGATVSSPATPTDYYYAFILTDGTDTDYYNDDVVKSVFEDNRFYQTGGLGRMTESHQSDGDYSLVFYEPTFKTPEWHKNSVGYQIFIDRFHNGNASNDPIGDGQSGDVIWWEWDSNGNGVLDDEDEDRSYVSMHESWDEAPTGGYDYFGGDLQGVMQKTDYLNELGVDFIWFNPFSEAPDNHGYSVDDYRILDSYYGVIDGRDGGRVLNDFNASMEFFLEFDQTLEANGIKIIYDTVINHASAQGLYFQRFEHPGIFDVATGFNVPDYYPEVLGAYENPYGSPYIDWFEFDPYNHEYNCWYGFNHIPTVMYSGTSTAMEELVTGSNNVFDFWMNYGVDGFRLDVNGIYADGDNSNTVNMRIRETVKATNPDAIIMGEIWERATQWLAGNMNDGTQNMPFRFNTIDWLRENYDDQTYTDLMHTIQENYPSEALYSMWVNLGNHDRTRIRSALQDNTEKVLVASTLQFGYPGVPVVWYGDEVGMTGIGDPGTRGTFIWGNENTTMLEHYKRIIGIKKGFPVMRQGDFLVLNDTQEGVITFCRTLEGDTYDAALIVGNRDALAKQVTIDVGPTGLEPDDVLADLLNGNATYVVNDNREILLTVPSYGRMILMTGIKDTPDPTETSTVTSTETSSATSGEPSTTTTSTVQTSEQSSEDTPGFALPFVTATALVIVRTTRRSRRRKDRLNE